MDRKERERERDGGREGERETTHMVLFMGGNQTPFEFIKWSKIYGQREGGLWGEEREGGRERGGERERGRSHDV